MLPVRIPFEQVNDTSVVLLDWLVADGSLVTAGQPVALIETSKATAQIEAPQAGYLKHGAIKGSELPITSIFCHIAADTAELIASSDLLTEPVAKSPTVSTDTDSGERFSRGALALIKRHNLSEALFKGRGLVRESDVRSVLGQGAGGTSTAGAAPPSSTPETAFVAGVPVRTEVLPRTKRIEGKYLAAGRAHTLASVVSVVCHAAELKAALRLQPQWGENPFVRPLAVVVYETARLLRKYPVFNAFHSDGKIHYYEEVNIGIAIDAGRQLKVPVIPRADVKEVAEIAAELENLLLAYMSDEIPVTALAGGTFTITDLSGEDVFLFHPLINEGQAAILGLGAVHHLSGQDSGFFNLILSFDHQLTEGRMAARFLRELRDLISAYESPAHLEPKQEVEELVCSHCRRNVTDPSLKGGRLLQEIRANGQKGFICASCLIEVSEDGLL